MILVERSDDDVKALNRIRYDVKELEDKGEDWRGIVVDKPWGHEIEIYRNGAISVWMLLIQGETSLHCHPNKRTMLVVESGFCVLETLRAVYPLTPGDVAVIERGAFHKTSSAECVVLEIESPINKRDLVRLSDKYGRKQGYLCEIG